MRILTGERFGKERDRKVLRKREKELNAETRRTQRRAERDGGLKLQLKKQKKPSSSIRASIRTRRRTSDTCGMQCLATRWRESCATRGTGCRFRTTLIIRACRWRTW